MTRQAHKAQTGRHGPRKGHGGPVDQRTAERPPRATKTATTATDGHQPRTDRQHGGRTPAARTASQYTSHTDDRHHGGRPRRRPVLAATSTASHTDTATDGGPHGPTTGGQYKPVFGEYGVSIAYTQVLVSGNATNTPASRAEVGEVIAAEVGPRSRGASSFELVRREHCPRST